MSGTDQRRRRVLRAVAPVAGLLAAGLLVWQGSYAAFSAQTNNTGNAWAAGTLTLTNDGGTGSYASAPFNTTGVFNQTNIKPGDTATKCLTVRAGGSSGGSLRLYRGAITGSAALANQISLTITATNVLAADPNVQGDCTGFTGTNVVATNTALSALPTTYATGLGATAVASGTRYVAYRFVYTFTSTGTNPGDNALQGTSAAADLSWEIQ
jgi:hypothetical protein